MLPHGLLSYRFSEDQQRLQRPVMVRQRFVRAMEYHGCIRVSGPVSGLEKQLLS